MPLSKNFIKWLKINKALINFGSDREKTHNVFEYGKFLSIHKDIREEFYKRLVESLNNGETNFIAEVRSEYFKFMVDIDFKSEFALTKDEKLVLLNLIQKSITETVGDKIENNYCIISSTQDQEITHEGEKMVKMGFHLIWPNMVVSEDEARFFRSAIIQYLEKAEEKFLSFGDWTDVVDASIYDVYHALRMNGSNKHEKCKTCKKKDVKRDECMDCNRTGWIDKGRVYDPFLIINPDLSYNSNLLKELQEDRAKDLMYTSIRTDLYKTNVDIKQKPFWFSDSKYEEHSSRKKKKNKSQSKSVKKNPLKNGKNQEDIPNTDKIYRQLKKFLQSELFRLSNNYSDIELDRLKKISINRKFVYVFTTKSHYCMNMEREHSSNHIYFVINSKKEVVQKCPSPWKNPDGICCNEFRSRPLAIPKDLYELLFLEKKEVKTILKDKKTVLDKKKDLRKSLLHLSLDD